MAAAGEGKTVSKPAAWRTLVQLFWSFFKLGPATFGGGYAMIPLIEREVVERRRWVEQEEVTDMFAVSGSIPGAIAINSATFVGFKIAGVRGAVAATIGVVLPTFLIVLGLCFAYLQVQTHPIVEAAFKGIRAAIVALIVYAGIKIGRTAVIDKTTLAAAAAAVLLLLYFKLHPIVIIACGALTGVVAVLLKEKMGYRIRHISKEEEKEQDKEKDKYVYQDYFVGDGI
ncbi:chromate transporter [Paenibacillus turpanensis]|uniref:chromate transporter n=1 Tax=Paenibacillus turpanensis TaxID=2689078 RepID=UPI0014077A53|nr:chromate transporter [Paenibacillus turpanensis]